MLQDLLALTETRHVQWATTKLGAQDWLKFFKIGSCGPCAVSRELNKMTAIEMYLRGSRSSAMWKPERSDGKFHFEA